MQDLTHENVVALHGLCCYYLPVYVVLEYCAKGALNTVLMTTTVYVD